VRTRRLILLVAALTTGCAHALPVTGPGQARAQAAGAGRVRLASAAQSARHLYVAQGFYGASAVYRYRLHADGLPSKNPDGELKLDFPFPGSIAVGPDGDLYVSSAGTASGCQKKSCFVAAFAPDASNDAKPIRVLYVPQVPVYLAVDQRGYLDVSTHPGWQRPVTNVYSPGAKGNDAPINEIAAPGVNALSANRGIVYIQTNQLGTGVMGIGEYSSSRRAVFYTYGNDYSSNGVATDATHLYAQFFWPANSVYDLATAVYHLDRPGSPSRTIVGTGCTATPSSGALGYGLAVYKKYLFEGCVNAGGSAGAVLIYDSTVNGRQAPIMKLPGGDAGVAIGP
jgi:hypothetical protein